MEDNMPDNAPETPAPAAPASPAPAAPAAADQYASLRQYIPAGHDPAKYVAETLEYRHRLETEDGGLEKRIRDVAMGQVPQFAEEFLRSPEGTALARRIGARAADDAGEELSPDERRLLQVADRAEAADERSRKAEETAVSTRQMLEGVQVGERMEGEFQAALSEQPEAEDWADIIREQIAHEAYGNPGKYGPGMVKRRALEIYAKLSEVAPRAVQRTATRGRTAGSAGGGRAAFDVRALSREDANAVMARIMNGEEV
jgi:hypothetical protein